MVNYKMPSSLLPKQRDPQPPRSKLPLILYGISIVSFQESYLVCCFYLRFIDDKYSENQWQWLDVRVKFFNVFSVVLQIAVFSYSDALISYIA
uniref:XK-related protein n=1 Tax=Heterorhabditis bacteriophora TaxID=37862 RepID=A0A1I7W7B9_HETBA